ncbi:pro-neuregulin-2, membrane-bound isoform [Dendroctonus ponderosae]|uniref:pro-neuregulin-2, membrane-bound isoform n=1 Tax=Dendroctonus ponderosae TaxID=77166 RepID=UPI002035612F|nr:pro-neuregulin-2, membrane-bound isoform [Dendroctonus ponderosae]XP_048521049.1 pro-neuregulin-2, membrane-bound isoform [Dendroctonus ponderosae]
MCRISYEKCICFVFLIVILVVLICSGFPTDNLVTPNSSKKYFRTSMASSSHFLSRVSNVNPDGSVPARARHHRQLRAAKRDSRTSKTPTGHIEATVYQNDANPSELTKTLNTRSQRSSGRSRNRQKTDCQPEHFSSKAYKSQIVLTAKAQGFEKINHKVSFKLVQQLKNVSSIPIHECLNPQFSNRTERCDSGQRDRKNLVSANIRGSREYILFFNISGANECTPAFSPELLRRKKKEKMLKTLEKVTRHNFKIKPPKIHIKFGKVTGVRKVKLICNSNGLPVPQISWRRDNVPIVNMPDVTIKYVKNDDLNEGKRSILTIKNHSQDHIGWYECVARGVDGKEVVERIEVKQQQIPFSEPILTNKKCNGTYEEEFCMHGTCYMDYNNEFFCECMNGYIGQRCAEKDAQHSAKRHLKDSDSER